MILFGEVLALPCRKSEPFVFKQNYSPVMSRSIFCARSESSEFANISHEHVLRKVREKLKEIGYKSGRVSQLVGATRPSSSSGLKRPAAAATGEEEEGGHERPQGRPPRKRPAASAEAVAAPKRRVRGKQTVPAYDPPAVEALVAREDRPSKLCLGFEEGLCIFSTQVAGEKARIHPDRRGGKHCVFCSQDNFKRAVATPRGKGVITAALAFFQENNDEAFELACSRINGFTDEAALQGCLDRLARLQKKGATQEVRGRTARERSRSERRPNSGIVGSICFRAACPRRSSAGQRLQNTRTTHRRTRCDA